MKDISLVAWACSYFPNSCGEHGFAGNEVAAYQKVMRHWLSHHSTRSPCVEFDGYRIPTGYGRRRYQGRMTLAHRVAWVEAHGDIPDGSQVLHMCDNPPCVNVGHLFLGDPKTNVLDMIRKGRHWNQKKTHCPYGHPFSGDNLYLSRGRRYCRACRRARSAS